MINYLFNSTNKPFIALLLINSIATMSCLQAMDKYPHNTIIVKNENNDNLSSLQINYSEVELLPSQKNDRFGKKINYLKHNLVGRNTILNSATDTKCRIARYGETSLLEIRNHNANIYSYSSESNIYGISQQKDYLQLRTHNNDIIVIENKVGNRVNIKHNNVMVGYLIY